jgi:hypothetical protein
MRAVSCYIDDPRELFRCQNASKKTSNEEAPAKPRSGRRADPISLAPLTMDQAVDAIFAIKPEDVKEILSSRPGKGKK